MECYFGCIPYSWGHFQQRYCCHAVNHITHSIFTRSVKCKHGTGQSVIKIYRQKIAISHNLIYKGAFLFCLVPTDNGGFILSLWSYYITRLQKALCCPLLPGRVTQTCHTRNIFYAIVRMYGFQSSLGGTNCGHIQ